MTTAKKKPVTEPSPATDASLARFLEAALRPLRGARTLASETGRPDDGRDIGVVISVLAHCARRIDSRESSARRVVAFRPEVTPKFES